MPPPRQALQGRALAAAPQERDDAAARGVRRRRTASKLSRSARDPTSLAPGLRLLSAARAPRRGCDPPAAVPLLLH
jgi:hypothetical protein